MLVLVVMLLASTTWAKVPVSITAFENQVDETSCDMGWPYWRQRLGSAFKDMLAREVALNTKVEIFERDRINDIYEGEHNLVNSEASAPLKSGKFKKARFTLVGAVTEYEYCAGSTGGSIGIGKVAGIFGQTLPDIEVGLSKSKAKVGVDLRLIDTVTGRIVRTSTAQGERLSSGVKIESDYASFGDAQKSPMGEAIREAIAKASKDVLSYF